MCAICLHISPLFWIHSYFLQTFCVTSFSARHSAGNTTMKKNKKQPRIITNLCFLISISSHIEKEAFFLSLLPFLSLFLSIIFLSFSYSFFFNQQTLVIRLTCKPVSTPYICTCQLHLNKIGRRQKQKKQQ